MAKPLFGGALSGWLACLAALAFAVAAHAQASERPLAPVAVSDGQHVWFFQPAGIAENTRIIVLHHGPRHAKGQAEQASIVEDMPEAALAVDSRLYCIFRGKRNPAGGFQNRSVSTVRAEAYDPRSRAWVYEPSPRARTVADLPGAGRINGFVADGREPLVLLTAFADAPQTEATEGGPGLPQLLRLALPRGEWEPVALPPDARDTDRFALLAGVRPILLVSAPSGESTAYSLESDSTWSAESVEVAAERIADSAVYDGQSYAALSTDAADELEIVLLRPPHVYPVARIKGLPPSTRLIDFGSSLALATAPPEGDRLSVTSVDVESGKTDEAVELRQRLRPAFEDFSLLVLVGALLFAILIMFIFRPADPARMNVTPPRGARVAEPRRRVVALLIDLLPSALLAGLVLDVPLKAVFDIAQMPMRAQHIEQSWPMMLMFLICIGHCTLSELLWGRTLGKALMDCWVVGTDGQRAKVAGVLVRNAMKFVALNVPLLFLFVYINQYRQRLGDLAGRTIVVTHHDGPEPSDASIDREA
ncbi:MAG: RDD family protein [Phycisphaerales bacterium]|nr:RDD family protein [Phycisphaerales bacterium]